MYQDLLPPSLASFFVGHAPSSSLQRSPCHSPALKLPFVLSIPILYFPNKRGHPTHSHLPINIRATIILPPFASCPPALQLLSFSLQLLGSCRHHTFPLWWKSKFLTSSLPPATWAARVLHDCQPRRRNGISCTSMCLWQALVEAL